jgi:hypothetical protein
VHLQQRVNLNLHACPQDSAFVGTSDEAPLRQKFLAKVPSGQAFCFKPDKVTASEAGELKLLEDGSANIEMPLLRTGSSRLLYLQDIANCIKLLGQLNADFKFGLTAGSTEPKCSFQVCKEHVEKLPLLRNLATITSEASPNASKETPENVCTVPFEPPEPAGASGIACLLILLEQKASPQQIFGAYPCGPRLAIQCLSVRLASSPPVMYK